MKCTFSFYNKTLNKFSESIPSHLYILYTNINQSSYEHIFNIINFVMIKNNWNFNHLIEIKCCCSKYLYYRENLQCIYNKNSIKEKHLCDIEYCWLCNK